MAHLDYSPPLPAIVIPAHLDAGWGRYTALHAFLVATISYTPGPETGISSASDRPLILLPLYPLSFRRYPPYQLLWASIGPSVRFCSEADFGLC